MYSSDKFNEIIAPFSSHRHNGKPIKPSDFKITDFPEPKVGGKLIPDSPIIHHVVCGFCGKDLVFEEGKSKINLGRNPMEETKIEATVGMIV